jgi:hypothetical protein
VVEKVVSSAAGRAGRHAVSLHLEASPRLHWSTCPKLLGQLVRALCDHAIAASPRNATIRVAIELVEGRPTITVEDEGPVVPEPARAGLLRNRMDPSSLGRPGGVALLAASTLADCLEAELLLVETPAGRHAARILLPSR